MRYWLAIALSAVLVTSMARLHAQPPDQKLLAFEVASIKPTSQIDYALRRPPSPDRFVRQILAERFHLSVHTETRELPRYQLLKARADGRLGDKLQPSNVDCEAITSAPDYKLPSGLLPGGEVPPCIVMLRVISGTPTITMRGTSIARLTRVLQGSAGRVVVDKTGLTRAFDVDFETEMPSSSPPTTPPREGLSLFTVLEEQLGLKLESERGPVDVLVIDHVEKPTPD